MAETQPPLNKTHKLKHLDRAKKYLKTDFLKIFMDWWHESDSWPDEWAPAWISNRHRAPLWVRHQQGGGGVLVWAGIIKDELVGPCWVGDELKINSQTFCQFLEDMFFKRCYRKKSSFKKTMIITQDNAPSRASKYSSAWLANKGLKDKKKKKINLLWLRGRASALLSEGGWFDSPGLHFQVSLAKILNPKLFLMCWSSPHMAATAISVWMYVGITVSRFGQKAFDESPKCKCKGTWSPSMII